MVTGCCLCMSTSPRPSSLWHLPRMTWGPDEWSRARSPTRLWLWHLPRTTCLPHVACVTVWLKQTGAPLDCAQCSLHNFLFFPHDSAVSILEVPLREGPFHPSPQPRVLCNQHVRINRRRELERSSKPNSQAISFRLGLFGASKPVCRHRLGLLDVWRNHVWNIICWPSARLSANASFRYLLLLRLTTLLWAVLLRAEKTAS